MDPWQPPEGAFPPLSAERPILPRAPSGGHVYTDECPSRYAATRRAQRGQVVAALLDGHGRQSGRGEQPAGRAVAVRGDLERALRVVGSGVHAERDDERVAAAPPTPRARATAASHGSSPAALGEREVAGGALAGAGAGLVGVPHDVREPARARVDVHRAVEHVVAVVEDRRGAVALVGVEVDDADPARRRTARSAAAATAALLR